MILQQAQSVALSKSTPSHFITMYSRSALSAAQEYLSHEKEVVISVLQQNPLIKNLVVIGSGPAAYLDTAYDFQCQYIGIDPFYRLKEVNKKNIFYFDCSFNDINRTQLPDGPCLFLFWFNVLHYLKDPVQALIKITKTEDIILHSTWSFKNDTTQYMKSYFREVYRDSAHCYQQAIKCIREKNNEVCLIELPTIKSYTTHDNQINRCIVLYL